jgi:manganese transport protein
MSLSPSADPEHPHSLEEIHGSIAIPKTWWRRFLAFSGPAYLISVGYMDPGNWGTDIEAGSRFGYRLLWVLLMSNLMAVLLQSLATRLGVVTGRDLAQACRENYPRPAVFGLWGLCEIAIAATDLAEVIGTIIGLKLLFGIPYLAGLAIAAADTFILLALQRRGVRLVELITLLLVGIIAGSFFIEIVMAKPVWADVVRGLVPGFAMESSETFRASLYVSIGMLGATVMPHNLYLHSALVQSRAFPQTVDGKRQACKYNLIDSVLALNGAFFVNAAILILAVSTFHVNDRPVETLQDAHELLGVVWGTSLASILFAVALLASGQSSTLTGTLAGQVVMEGFVHLRVRPWARRLVTRLAAIVPALVVIAATGHATDWDEKQIDGQMLGLLVLSQVILSLQLPFAIIPLVQTTGDRRLMGEFANRGFLKGLAWLCAAVVVGLNGLLIYMQIDKWADAYAEGGGSRALVYVGAGSVAAALGAFLVWVAAYPLTNRREETPRVLPAPTLPFVQYRRIGVGVELEGGDEATLAQAVALARSHGAELLAIHVVEGPAAEFHGPEADDLESREDRRRISELAETLRGGGLDAKGMLGYGNPADELVRIVTEQKIDLLVLGAHGHRFLADMALGQTVSPVLHRLKIPVLVVPPMAKS